MDVEEGILNINQQRADTPMLTASCGLCVREVGSTSVFFVSRSTSTGILRQATGSGNSPHRRNFLER